MKSAATADSRPARRMVRMKIVMIPTPIGDVETWRGAGEHAADHHGREADDRGEHGHRPVAEQQHEPDDASNAEHSGI